MLLFAMPWPRLELRVCQSQVCDQLMGCRIRRADFQGCGGSCPRVRLRRAFTSQPDSLRTSGPRRSSGSRRRKRSCSTRGGRRLHPPHPRPGPRRPTPHPGAPLLGHVSMSLQPHRQRQGAEGKEGVLSRKVASVCDRSKRRSPEWGVAVHYQITELIQNVGRNVLVLVEVEVHRIFFFVSSGQQKAPPGRLFSVFGSPANNLLSFSPLLFSPIICCCFLHCCFLQQFVVVFSMVVFSKHSLAPPTSQRYIQMLKDIHRT